MYLPPQSNRTQTILQKMNPLKQFELELGQTVEVLNSPKFKITNPVLRQLEVLENQLIQVIGEVKDSGIKDRLTNARKSISQVIDEQFKGV